MEYESYAFINRFSGPYSMSYWIMMTCNVVSPQLFWFKKIRRSLAGHVCPVHCREHRHVVRALRDHCDFTAPGLSTLRAWGEFHATSIDVGVFVGTLGIFFTLFLLFARFFPVLALNELKTILKSSGEEHKRIQSDGKSNH